VIDVIKSTAIGLLFIGGTAALTTGLIIAPTWVGVAFCAVIGAIITLGFAWLIGDNIRRSAKGES